MKIKIRPIKKSDNQALSKIIKDSFLEFGAPLEGTVFSDPTTENLYDFFNMQGSICWVGELNGKIAGCCGIYPTPSLDKDCCELVKFYLSKESRGFGVGKRLMYQCEASAIDLGYKKIYIESLPEFKKAVSIYEKAGYREIPEALGDSGHFGCSIYMLKDISYVKKDN